MLVSFILRLVQIPFIDDTNKCGEASSPDMVIEVVITIANWGLGWESGPTAVNKILASYYLGL